MVRAKLFKGLNDGNMNISSLLDDEKYKLNNSKCCYCGSDSSLSIDHLIPRNVGGEDSGDNFVYACKKCNSSKNNTDLIQWYLSKGEFPPILVLRRYLKLSYLYFQKNKITDKPYQQIDNYTNTYMINLLPYEFPEPELLKL